MKFIFDFDDVLFHNTKQFKEHMYMHLEKAGVPRNISEAHYKEVRENQFSLRNFINTLLTRKGIEGEVDELYENIMNKCENFTNNELTRLVKKIGSKNSLLVSNGEKVFQQDKIKRSGVGSLFCEIHITPGSKKEIVEKICVENIDEEIIFVDDKIKFFEDLDTEKYPNLKTILYDEAGMEKVRAIVSPQP